MNDIVEQHWNHGPHYQLRDSIIFITWRLAFTLPKHIQDLFKELSEFREKTDKTEDIELLGRQNQFLYNKFWEYDNALGSSHSSAFSLNSPDISKIVKGAFHFFDKHKYNLHAYCIMSNHVHIILEPYRLKEDSFYNVSDIIQSLKRYTANQINSHLDRKGQIWDDYYFDRIIRDSENYRNVVSYILNNPVKAGLIDESNKWKDSYFNPEFIQV